MSKEIRVTPKFQKPAKKGSLMVEHYIVKNETLPVKLYVVLQFNCQIPFSHKLLTSEKSYIMKYLLLLSLIACVYCLDVNLPSFLKHNLRR